MARASDSSLARSLTRAQYGAVARMRGRLLVNSLRTPRGKFEVAAQFAGTSLFLLLALTLAIACGFQARQFAARGDLQMLPVLLFPISASWLLLPLLLGPFGDDLDLTLLLRFPVNFRSYFGLSLLSGLFDLSSLLGGTALLGLWLGMVTARPLLLLWATLALGAFAAFNFFLTKAFFAWINGWLADRLSKTLLAIALLFFLVPLLLHPVGPVAASWTPPNLVAESIASAAEDHALRPLASVSLLVFYALIAGVLLGYRLHAEFRGETLTEPGQLNRSHTRAQARTAMPANLAAQNRSWWAPLAPVRAVVQKELRYFSRSGVLIFGFALPPVLLFLSTGAAGSNLGAAAPYALPLIIAVSFAPLTRQVSNSLGNEGAGIQFYFFSPTPFRTVMLGKNLLHLLLFGLELALAYALVLLRFGRPSTQMIVATFCWLLFALPMQLAIGNILSVTMAYRMTLTRISSEQGATGNGLLSLLVQLLLFGIGCAIYLPSASSGHVELAMRNFLVLAILAALFWCFVLSRIDGIAVKKRNALLAGLVRVM